MCQSKYAKQVQNLDNIKSLGPYSLGISVNGQYYLSGQIAIDGHGDLVLGDIKKQTAQIIDNIELILESVEMQLSDMVQMTVYLDDMDDYMAMNQVFAIYLSHPYPARSCVEVRALPKGAKIMIDSICVKGLVWEDGDDACESC